MTYGPYNSNAWAGVDKQGGSRLALVRFSLPTACCGLARGGAMAIVHVIQESVRGCRSVAFDEHALKRMNERNVTEDEVLDVLRNPTQTGLPTAPNRLRFRKHTGAASWVDVVF